MNTTMDKRLLCLVLFLWTYFALGQDTADNPMDPDGTANEDCLRCICHARSGCFFMRNCANYSISQTYWERANRPVVLDDNPYDLSSYRNCIRDDGCIMRAIRGYLDSMNQRDCNCDGVIDCKDYAAIHLRGDNCRSDFDRVQLRRLDACLQKKGYSITPGWNMECQLPNAQ